MSTLSTKASSYVTSTPPLSGAQSGEPVEVMNLAFTSDTVLGEIKTALGHLAVPTVGATTPTAGNVGEMITSTILVANTVSLTTATPANLTSISLSAGDWTVDGSVTFVLGSATCTVLAGGTSLTTATLDLDQFTMKDAPLTTTASQTRSRAIPTRHLQLATTTTVYLPVSATFSAGTVTSHGSLTARRAS